MSETDIEQPACFYLGREYDLATKSLLDRRVMYNARDLTTHGVVVGMTGSGKTGLCIDLLEEAAIDGIPCIIIDPKGDLTNLLLQFPDLDPKDFLHWLNPEDARQKGLSQEDYARQLAESWRKGLAEWDQTPERIRRLRESSEWRVYTPGSSAGLPLSILQTFAAPRGKVTREALNEKIDATATALLGLSGVTGDPVQSREHILIAQLLLHSWSAGRDLDLPQLIAQVQAPPLRKVGAFDVDTFYPEKDRLKLAVALNNILAAPSFSTWINGESLNLSRMLYAGDKPRQLIFYVAHLEDAQRMFFLTLLLEEVLSWTRAQPGTSSLRAILYFDEVYGYLPPYPANPPTKTPLMTLLKQARAFGVGVLLATQNPVDIDYKALSNAGTWFVGKLQTERDKARLLEGLEGVAAVRGTLTDRAYLETVISALGNRVFLLHDVHRGKPVVFQSRWALSFLRGPLTRDQVADVRVWLDPEPEEATAEAGEGEAPLAILLCRRCKAELGTSPGESCPRCGEPLPRFIVQNTEAAFKQSLKQTAVTPVADTAHVQPVAAGVSQFYLPVKGRVPANGEPTLIYQPRLLGLAEVIFLDKRKGQEHRLTYRLLAEPPAEGQSVSWAAAVPVGESLAPTPEQGARWADVPASLNTAKKLKTLEREFVQFLYARAKLNLLQNRTLGISGEPGDDPTAFRETCRQLARQKSDEELTDEEAKYTIRLAALADERRQISGEHGDNAAARLGPKVEETGSVLDFVFRKLNPFAARPPVPAPPPTPKAQASLIRAREAEKKVQEEWQEKVVAVGEKWAKLAEQYTELQLKPRKADVRVVTFGLAWAPYWQAEGSAAEAGETTAGTQANPNDI